MKTVKLLLVSMVVFLATSCSVDVYTDDYQDTISLPQLMEGYDLWYVNFDQTTGAGDVPFLTRAFTISFVNGTLYANNNLVGIGTTGNGFGVSLGYYTYTPTSVRCYHNIYGQYDLEVYQLSTNRIRLYDRFQNTSYYLTGYQRNSFNYDQLFFDNLQYFVQEYQAWEKVYTSAAGNPNVFDYENYLKFIPANNTFKSSQDILGLSLAQIYWDFTGNYTVQNTSTGAYTKRLNLFYSTAESEQFNLTVINDGRIRLYHISSGTTYEFQGRGFIPFMRTKPKK